MYVKFNGFKVYLQLYLQQTAYADNYFNFKIKNSKIDKNDLTYRFRFKHYQLNFQTSFVFINPTDNMACD